MTRDDFERMISRLEQYSAERPGGYQARVAGLAGLGLLILFGIVGFAALLLAGLVAIVIAVVVSGGAVLLLLLKLGKLLLLLALPLWVLVRSSFQAMFARFPEPQGQELGQERAPALFERLAWMRSRMRGPRFHHVLLTDDLNASVVQRPLFGLLGFPRNYLILGLPLLESLTESEALAVVAHEYGHLAGAHNRFGAFIYRLRHTWGTIDAIAQQWDGLGGRMLGRVVRWYAPYFNAYTFVLARSHEYLADAASSELVGREHASSGLKRVNVTAQEYQVYLDDTFDRVRTEAEPPAGFAHRWTKHLALGTAPDRSRKHLEQSLARKTDHLDTHPALFDRLTALGVADPQAVPPMSIEPSAAQAWFGGELASIRAAVESAWVERLREPWRNRFSQLEQARARLIELDAIDAPTRDEQWERLTLRRQVAPDAGDADALDAFVAAWPDDPRGHFVRGRTRLENDDADGLDDLETAMRLDPECIVAASSMAAAFLHDRDRTRADAYADRAQRRHALEQQRLAEMNNPNARQGLRAHGLPPETLHAIEEALRAAGVEHLGKAYLVRRELPADPSVETYLLAVTLTWWGRRRGKQQAVVEAVAAIALPVPNLFVCTVEGARAALGKAVRRIDGSELKVR